VEVLGLHSGCGQSQGQQGEQGGASHGISRKGPKPF
jgi:hypothetical protein